MTQHSCHPAEWRPPMTVRDPCHQLPPPLPRPTPPPTPLPLPSPQPPPHQTPPSPRHSRCSATPHSQHVAPVPPPRAACPSDRHAHVLGRAGPATPSDRTLPAGSHPLPCDCTGAVGEVMGRGGGVSVWAMGAWSTPRHGAVPSHKGDAGGVVQPDAPLQRARHSAKSHDGKCHDAEQRRRRHDNGHNVARCNAYAPAVDRVPEQRHVTTSEPPPQAQDTRTHARSSQRTRGMHT